MPLVHLSRPGLRMGANGKVSSGNPQRCHSPVVRRRPPHPDRVVGFAMFASTGESSDSATASKQMPCEGERSWSQGSRRGAGHPCYALFGRTSGVSVPAGTADAGNSGEQRESTSRPVAGGDLPGVALVASDDENVRDSIEILCHEFRLRPSCYTWPY